MRNEPSDELSDLRDKLTEATRQRDEAEREKDELARDERIFIPGVWRCPRCEFELVRTSIDANSGRFGTTTEDRYESEGCPNDGTEMVRVSWKERVADLSKHIDTPEIHDFIGGAVSEAQHQRSRWGTEHDEGKSPSDWLWLVAYLATKATQAERYGDHDRYLHHIITCAAACANWHAHANGDDCSMKPGAPTPGRG